MNINLGKYSKAIVALLAALGVVGAALADGRIDSNEAIAIGSAFAGVIAVYKVKNAK